MAELLLGKEVAGIIASENAVLAAQLQERGVESCLAIIRVGERQDDIAYESSLLKRCAKEGIVSRQTILPEDVSEDRLLTHIAELNADGGVHGIMIFRPLPKQLDEARICDAIAVHKDVDGVSSASMAALYADTGSYFAPCTAEACIRVLEHYNIPLQAAKVAVIGRSLVIGKPVSLLLLQKNATVTICHSRTHDLPGLCSEADIIIAATGRAEMVDAAYVSAERGQVLIDVGINVNAEGKMCGDVNAAAIAELVKAYTPVPGGVGTVTTALLMQHVLRAALRK